MRTLEEVLVRHSHVLELGGVLNSVDAPKNESHVEQYSDSDVFLVLKGGKPSQYFMTCINICSEMLRSQEDIFLFASFKQQILLKALALRNHARPIHYLQYLSVRHLIIREINTLPRFVKDSIKPVANSESDIFDRIAIAYKDRATFLHPSVTRYYYYFDILNETLPLFSNYQSTVLPYTIVAQEAIHKIRFVSRYLTSELLAHSNSFVLKSNSDKTDILLREIGHDSLAQVRNDVYKIERIAPNDIPPTSIIDMLRRLYSTFDTIEELVDYGNP